jgi:hypothetical protein
MDAHKLQVKVFAESHDGLTPETFIPIFHTWIKDHVLPDLLVDVANYAHVPKGPGVVLIGHEYDTFIDETAGRFGVLHNRKRGGAGAADRLADAFRRALHAAALLEADPAVSGKLKFSTDEFLVRVNDRLAAPNDEATFAALAPELEAFGKTLFAGPVTLERAGDAKSLFSVTLSGAGADLKTLLARVGGSSA